MKIRFWGARGSVAVFGKRYNRYGGNTCCVEVRLNDGSLIIIDAGTGIRGLGNRLSKARDHLIHMFITHSHWDHLLGFPFFKPIYSRETHIKIYAPHSTNEGLEKAFKVMMQEVYHPIPFAKLVSKIEFLDAGSESIMIGGASIDSIQNNHPAVCHSIRIEEDGKRFVFMTDNELSQENPLTGFEEFVAFADRADYLIHDSMYFDEEMSTKRGWGHSSVGEVARLVSEAGVRRVGLFHHDPDRSDRDIDRMVASCRKKLGPSIEVAGVAEGMELKI